jgi:hypothetical protein
VTILGRTLDRIVRKRRDEEPGSVEEIEVFEQVYGFQGDLGIT